MSRYRQGSAIVAALIAIAFSPAAQAEAASRSLEPVDEAENAAYFQVRGFDANEIRRAKFRAMSGERRIRRDVDIDRVRQAAESGGWLRVAKPERAKNERLDIVLTDETVEPPVEPPVEDGCILGLGDCSELFSDVGNKADAEDLWGTIGCQADSRHQLIASGGDSSVTALGLIQPGDSFRRLTTIDGDDYYGERCEIGRNEHRYGTGGGDGTAALFREGQRRVTSASFRLPSNFPLETDKWQVVMQMKQAQPSANGGGTPALALRAYRNRWALVQSDSSGPTSVSHDIWSAPAERNKWTRFAFDVTYSQDPNIGRVKVYVDLNGDGDMVDAGEQSPRFETYTMKREISGGNPDDGIAPGESIPSHLRVGIYHDPTVACPPPNGCSVDVDNVQVVAP